MSGIPISKDTPKTPFTVKGITLEAPQPFVEGYTLRANDASVLNQVYVENLRNNLAKEVGDEVETAKTEGREPALAALQAKLDEYVKTYDFGVRVGGRVTDPVEKEAMNIAKGKVREALKKKGHNLKEVGNEKIAELAAAALEQHPQIREAAKKIVRDRAKIGDDLGIAV